MTMMTETLTVYDTWDLQVSAMPPRSRLYSLEPVGLGTAQVESLTSYISRLAEAHRVSTGKLVMHEILPLFGRSYLPGNMTPFWQRQARALNGTGTWACDFLQVMETLTLRSDLQFLTWLPWSNILSPRGLLRDQRAWCPVCLETYRQTGGIIYEPLLWTLKVVTICPAHRQRLTLVCPHCQKTVPWLEKRLRPGYCSRCRAWLGVSTGGETTNQPELSVGELEWQQWIVEAIGELVAIGPTLAVFPDRKRVAMRLSEYLQKVGGGQTKLFREKLHTHNFCIKKGRLWKWQKGKNIPQFKHLLSLCYCLNTSPLRFLTDQTAIEYPVKLKSLSFNDQHKESRKPRNPHSLDELQQALEAVLVSDEESPPSLNQVAKRLGYYEHTQLSQRLPELSRAISERHRVYRKNKSLQTQQLMCHEIRKATFKIYAEGKYPALGRVTHLLSKPRHVFNPSVKAAWYDAMQELGLQP